MEGKKHPRNAPCPCGSGKKYKNCCLKKGIGYAKDEGGGTEKLVPINEELRVILADQRKRFIEKFGREPGPGDRVLFDMPPVEHLEAEMVEMMKKTGAHPAAIYAFEKTGLLVTEGNRDKFTDADLAEWDAAVEEYLRSHEGSEGG